MRQTRSSLPTPSKQIAARVAFAALMAVVAASALSCGGDSGKGALQIPSQDDDPQDTNPAALPLPQLLADDVAAIMQSAARALDRELVVAVTDRRGVILGVGTTFAGEFDFETECAALECPATDIPALRDPVTSAASDCEAVELAVQLARTASFFSARQTPLTSRSVRFISGEHFPPGIKNSGAAALFGIENTNRGCSFDAESRPFEESIPRGRSLSAVLRDLRGGEPLACESSEDPTDQCGCSRGIATLPGGVPIYKSGPGGVNMVGGVGVALRGVPLLPDAIAAFEALLPETDPHSSNAVLRREFDNLPQSSADAFNLAEFAARAFAGDRVGFPILRAKGLNDVCNDPGVTPPACCRSESPPCFFNILPAQPPIPFDPVIFIDGIEVPEVNPNPPAPDGAGTFERELDFIINPAVDIDQANSDRSGQPVPAGDLNIDMQTKLPGQLDDYLVDPTLAENLASDSPDGAAPLTAQEVVDIIKAGVDEALKVRAAIRLPLESRTAMVLAVSDTNGKLLGAFRMPDATVFSIDVAIAKSRNVNYFSSPSIDEIDTMDCPGAADCRGLGIPPGTAVTNRTISFAAQPFFPSGIEGHLRDFDEPYAPGPYRRVFLEDSANQCTNGREPRNGRQNGIVFFPGSTPIYKNGVLVGGFGVSGDGVEQDDIVTFAGARFAAAGNFLPEDDIRADQVFVRGVRLPYLKFNRAPDQ